MRLLILIAVLVLGVIFTAQVTRPPRDAPCRVETFEASRFTVCVLDTRKHDLALYTDGADAAPLRTFEALEQHLGGDAARVRFAMNAGMFDDTGSAIGLLVREGRQEKPLSTSDGPGNFHMKPNGVLSVDEDGAVHVETTEAYAARAPSPRWATQSGPMLVIGGKLHPQIQDDGPSRNIRNGVGMRSAHEAVFAISHGAVSFGKLARLFRDRLDCEDALYFDGTVSGLWDPRGKQRDDGFEIGPMAVVFDKT